MRIVGSSVFGVLLIFRAKSKDISASAASILAFNLSLVRPVT